MKHYDNIPRVQDDETLKGKLVWGFNKLDGQNFCVVYNPETCEFGPYGSQNAMVDERTKGFRNIIRFFKNSQYTDILNRIVKEHRNKGDVFHGIKEITFFFEWYGENSFAGRHRRDDEMHLALIDVFLKRKGYMKPEDYYRLFKDSGIELPELIYTGVLTSDIIEKIRNNDWTMENSEFPSVKEGVIFKCSEILKGQRRPQVKVKTKWWLNKTQKSSRLPENIKKEIIL